MILKTAIGRAKYSFTSYYAIPPAEQVPGRTQDGDIDHKLVLGHGIDEKIPVNNGIEFDMPTEAAGGPFISAPAPH
jgi:hypothetical protein